MKRNVFRRCTLAPRKTTPRALSKMGVVMSKNWILLTGLLLLASMGTSQAHPLDSPDIVYIDGQPCNTACQNYLAWTRRQTSRVIRHSAPVESEAVEVQPLQFVPAKPALRSRRSAARHAATPRQASRPAASRVAKQAVPAKVASPQPAPEAATTRSEPGRQIVETPPSAESAAAAQATQVGEKVTPAAPAAEPAAAAPAAEPVTTASVAPAPQPEATSTDASATTGSTGSGDAAPTVSAKADNGDVRVAVVMTRPEIEKLSDLAGKDVAIEEQQSEASTSIQAAIASAGAAEVRLNEGAGNAIERLLSGEVPAAVLAIASPKASEGFSELPGYRLFRIPLTPNPSKG
jgi:hypothetical protein